MLYHYHIGAVHEKIRLPAKTICTLVTDINFTVLCEFGSAWYHYRLLESLPCVGRVSIKHQ